MTLIVKLSRPATARGQDVISAALASRPAVAGFLVKETIVPLLGLEGISKLSGHGEERLLILDLKVEDAPDDLAGLQSLSGLVTGITVSYRLATSRDWPAVANTFSGARLIPVLALTRYELEQGHLTAEGIAEVLRSSGIREVLLATPDVNLVRHLTALNPGVRVFVEGVELGSGICAGASYEVIGQEVLDAEDPIRSVRLAIYNQRRGAEDCRAGPQPVRAFQM